ARWLPLPAAVNTPSTTSAREAAAGATEPAPTEPGLSIFAGGEGDREAESVPPTVPARAGGSAATSARESGGSPAEGDAVAAAAGCAAGSALPAPCAGLPWAGDTSMRRICPAPAGAPKPMFETYSAPSGPKVIAVGKVRPVAIVSSVP